MDADRYFISSADALIIMKEFRNIGEKNVSFRRPAPVFII